MAPLVMGSIPIILPKIKYAVVAQLVEHVSEEHGVGCSIHSRRTNVQMAKLDQRVSLQN